MNRVAGKVARITGGRGAGAAHARLLTADGASAVLADVLDADGEALAVDLGHAARFVHPDVTQESDWATPCGSPSPNSATSTCSSTMRASPTAPRSATSPVRSGRRL
jgi:NAD(P)-dependent dehydrogenase (short-subunit alcohol dehydrogenase family)